MRMPHDVHHYTRSKCNTVNATDSTVQLIVLSVTKSWHYQCMTSSTGLMSPIEYDLSSQCSWIDVSMELLRRTWWTVVHSQQKSLAVNICVLPLSGSWSYRTIDWKVSVVGPFLWQARRLGIRCQTVFVTQNWVSILSNVIGRRTFLRTVDDKMY